MMYLLIQEVNEYNAMFFNGRHYNNKDDCFSVGGRKCHVLSRY